MNLTFLSKTDKELEELRLAQTTDGKNARKEIQRRKLVGYWDGTMAVQVDAKAQIEEQETRVGTVYINGVQQ